MGNRTITEFNYRYTADSSANVFAGIRLRRGEDELKEVLSELTNEGIDWIDLSDNEVAKQHVRYMIGGRVAELNNERLYSFEFPQLPGALPSFLHTLGGLWNITLFHYRNHDAAEAMVLVGFDVPDQEVDNLQHHLSTLGYNYSDETENPAYHYFLKA